MNEKWETEFFEWKDGIEVKFNNLSQKNIELEKKLDFMESEFKCTPKSFSIWVKKCKQNKEQINDLKNEVFDCNNNSRIDEVMGDMHVNAHNLVELKEILRELHELMRGLVSDLQDSNSLSKTTIKCYEGKLVKNLEKLDSKKEECLLKKPHASAVSVERKLIEKCQCPIHKDSGKRNMEFYNKGYEVGCETGYKLGKNDSIKKFLKKELYELYLKDKGECYFKKITHPFTEYNNMVHRGTGMKLTPYDTEEKLIEGFIKVLKAFKCGCGDGFDLQIIEEYEGMLNK